MGGGEGREEGERRRGKKIGGGEEERGRRRSGKRRGRRGDIGVRRGTEGKRERRREIEERWREEMISHFIISNCPSFYLWCPCID